MFNFLKRKPKDFNLPKVPLYAYNLDRCWVFTQKQKRVVTIDKMDVSYCWLDMLLVSNPDIHVGEFVSKRMDSGRDGLFYVLSLANKEEMYELLVVMVGYGKTYFTGYTHEFMNKIIADYRKYITWNPNPHIYYRFEEITK